MGCQVPFSSWLNFDLELARFIVYICHLFPASSEGARLSAKSNCHFTLLVNSLALSGLGRQGSAPSSPDQFWTFELFSENPKLDDYRKP